MLDAAERAGVVHLVGNEFRWLPDRVLVARAIAEGLIGEPRLLTMASYTGLVADPEMKMPRWWFDAAAGGGWLGAQGAHLIDQVRTWLGDFASLSAALPIASARSDVAEDSYVIRFRLRNGVEGVLQQTAGAWGPSATMTRVAGTEGVVWVDGADVWLANRDGKRQLMPTPDLELPPPPPAVTDDSRRQFSQFEMGPYVRLAEALRARVDGREPSAAVPLPTFADGVAAMQVIDAARASAAKDGARIEI
jgi:predicted dehydrogenase